MQVGDNVNATLNQASIITHGNASWGIWQTGIGSTTTVTDTAIHTYGDSAVGVVNYGGVINVNGGSIVTEGQSAHGLYAADNTGTPGAHAILNANNVNVTTNGNSHGAVVLEGAEMAITGGNITSNGTGIAAAYVNGRGVESTKLTIDGTQLVTTGSDSNGVKVVNNGEVSLNNVAIQSTLGGGLASTATMDGINKTINVSNTTVAAQKGSAISYSGGSADINLSNSNFDGATLIHVSDNVVDPTTTIAAGTTNLNANNSYLNGAIGAIVDSGTLNLNLNQSTLNGDINVTSPAATANLNLINNSLFKGAAHNVEQLAIDSSSNWLLTGDSTVNTTTNGGTITFDPASSFKTLSTNNYVGNGGKLVMNTALGDDSSATDKLVIDGGHASGTTDILVNNAGGAGAQTDNGILLVEAINGGTTDTAAFKL
ncbi:MAG: autotransporter outer membrane beta-barrel domain-containing protein, partial [Glaciimonas sp.]|nr:autotransporter outer membrane beta-barrel domain-containing protein [Glaciimonas sp.]